MSGSSLTYALAAKAMLISTWDRTRVRRLAWITLGFGIPIIGGLLVSPWLWVIQNRTFIRTTVIGFLLGLEVAYAVVVVGVLIGMPVFGRALYRSWCNGAPSQRAARGLLLCVCSVLGLVLAETIVAARRAVASRLTLPNDAEPKLSFRVNRNGVTRIEKGELAGKPLFDPARLEPRPPRITKGHSGAHDSQVTVVVLGESSATGMPYNAWLSIGSIVAWQLERAIPGKHFGVEMLARPGDTLSGQYRKLAELGRRPDVLIVYAGHNEFIATIPWMRRVHHYNDDDLGLLFGIDKFAGRVSPIFKLVRETADKYRVMQEPLMGATQPLVDAPAYSPGELAERLTDFRRRLDEIAAYGERIGALTILVAPPSNGADFDPNRSFLPAETPRAQRAAFERAFQAARRAENAERERAVELYRSLLAWQPGFAETHYRLGRLLEQSGAWDEAYLHYIRARDLDGFPMRCLTPFQEAYLETAARHDCIVVDGQALFHSIGPHGLLNDYLFHDAMHPSLRGHIALAQAILDSLYARRAFGWPAGASAPSIDPISCATHFGLKPKDWKPLCERGYMFYHMTAALRYDPSQRQTKKLAFKNAAERIARGEPAEAVGLPNVGVPAAMRAGPGTAGSVGAVFLLAFSALAGSAAAGEPRLNQIQVIGSHNSYHIAAAPAVLDLIGATSRRQADSLDYTHRPLAQQFGELGIRQIELDLFADPQGGLFAQPRARKILADRGKDAGPDPDADGQLRKPGLKVLHVPDVDFRSTAPTFVDALRQIRAWSQQNRRHVPILVLLELKDESIFGVPTKPVRFDRAELDAVDAEIRSIFAKDEILTPDRVRGRFATLPEAIHTEGWPLLESVRGLVMFALDNEGAIRDRYLQGHPSLKDRLLFTTVASSHPAAAWFKINDPVKEFDRIQELVRAGFLVRTRADADTRQARSGDASQRDKAMASGAQFISTDYRERDPRFSEYSVRFPGHQVARSNPVSGDPAWADLDLETGKAAAQR
jgi:tetratricopeptide (TPR) repeat protein